MGTPSEMNLNFVISSLLAIEALVTRIQVPALVNEILKV